MLLRKLAVPLLRQASCTDRPMQLACVPVLQQRGFSTNAATPSPLYELRIYRTYPKDFKRSFELFNEYIHIRMKHSKLFGFWTAEIGDSIWQPVHIWEYDSPSHRLKVRKGLLQDQAWQTQMMAQLTPCMESMTNTLIVLAPQTRLDMHFAKDPTAVYELQTVDRMDSQNSPVHSNRPAEILVGRFWGVYGPTKTEYRLWRYPNIDAAMASSWHRAQEYPEQGKSLLMYPTGFSPMQ